MNAHAQVTKAVVDEVGADRVGIRLSPFGGFLDVSGRQPAPTAHRPCLLTFVAQPVSSILWATQPLPCKMLAQRLRNVLPAVREFEKLILKEGKCIQAVLLPAWVQG